MNNTLRAASLFLALLLVVTAFTGCQRENPGQTTPPETTSAVETTTDPVETTVPATQPPVTQPPVTDPPATNPPEPTQSQENLGLVADQAFVYDVTNDEYIYLLGHYTDWVFPASTTKVFNAWVALQYLDPNQIITAGEEITFIEDMASVAELRQGDACSVADMVKCMLLPSGCDAAYVLAVSAGRVIAGNENLDARSAVDVFVAEMNRQAKLNGMVNTHFVTPDGYHRSDHFISLDAFVKIGKLCLANEAIMAATQTYSCDIHFQNGRTMTMVNLNEVINPNSIYYRSACIGLKTGRTDAAGSCMLAAYRDEDDDRILLIGVFGCPAKDDRYGTANTLFDYFS